MNASLPINAVFTVLRNDHFRAAPLGRAGFEQLIDRLGTVVMPELARAADALDAKGLRIIKLEHCKAHASLVMTNKRSGMNGLLHFQIHRSPGRLPTEDQVSWMYAVRRGNGPETGRPGIMQHLDDAGTVRKIVQQFVAVWLTVASSAELASSLP